MKLLSLTVLLIAFWSASAGPLDTHKQCEWGPSYWCQTYKNARTCGQIEYCQTHVWKSVQLKQVPCSGCIALVTIAKNEFDNNSTESAAKQKALDECANFPTFEEKCQEFIEEHFGTIWDLLQNEHSPTAICEELEKCTSGTLTIKDKLMLHKIQQLKKSQSVQLKEVPCAGCIALVTIAKNEFDNNSTESAAKQKALDECANFPTFEEECQEFIEEHFGTIWDLLQNGHSPTAICEELEKCTSGTLTIKDKLMLHKIQQLKKSQSVQLKEVPCAGCIALVTIAKNEFDNNSTESAAKQKALDECANFPTFEEECQEFIEEHFGTIWDLLQNGHSPTAICEELEKCTSGTLTIKDKLMLHKIQQLKKSQSVQLKEVPCAGCIALVTIAKNEFDNNSTESAAKQKALDECANFPTFEEECQEFIEEHFGTIWDLLQNGHSPTAICEELEKCTSGTLTIKDKLMLHKIQQLKKSQSVQLKEVPCAGCIALVTIAKNEFDNNSTESAAKQKALDECANFPTFEEECQEFIEEHFGTIWDLLQNGHSPTAICEELEKCTSGTLTIKDKLMLHKIQQLKKSQSVQLKEVPCAGCIALVTIAKNEFDNNSTESAAKQKALDECANFPTFEEECQEFIEEHFGTIWDLLQNGHSPTAICEELEKCTSGTLTIKDKLMLHKIQQLKKSQSVQLKEVPCAGCIALVTIAKNEFDNNSTESAAKQKALDECANFPTFEEECQEFIEEHFGTIWDLLQNGHSPTAICEELEECTSGTLTTKWLPFPVPKKHY